MVDYCSVVILEQLVTNVGRKGGGWRRGSSGISELPSPSAQTVATGTPKTPSVEGYPHHAREGLKEKTATNRGPHLFHIHERRLEGQMTHILHHKPRPPSTRCSCDLPRTAATYSGRYNIMKKINRGSHKNVLITRNHTLILLLSAGEHLPRHHELPTQPSRKKDQESNLFLSKTNVTHLNSPLVNFNLFNPSSQVSI